MKNFTVLDLLDLDLKAHNALELRCLTGRKGLTRTISIPELNRPGLALCGFFESFVSERIQIFGRGEHSYLTKLAREGNLSSIEQLFKYEIPCFIFCHNLEPDEELQGMAERSGIPVLQTPLESSDFSVRLLRALSDIFAPERTMHGVLVEVWGTGVLIMGESGVGKSESALELVERGHSLIADDAVNVKCMGGNILMGTPTAKVIGHHMEIRGIGIVDISRIFGVIAIKDKKQVEIVVQLEEWDAKKAYNRVGEKGEYINILGVNIPLIKIPVRPGRNIPIIIETAVLNERLKMKGMHTAKEFDKNIIQWLESESARTRYFDNST
jgi:HPr kinase/phosphorylase